jgi:N-acetylmuramoyl-L-alanine amidase
MSSSLFPSARFLFCLLICFIALAPPQVADHFLSGFLPATASAVASAGAVPIKGPPPTKINLTASADNQGTRISVQLGAPLLLLMRQEDLRVILLFGSNAVELSPKDFHYDDPLVSSITLDPTPAVNQLSIQLKNRNIQTRLSHFDSQNLYLLELRKQENPPVGPSESSSPEVLPLPTRKDTSRWGHITIDAGHGGQDKGAVIKEDLFEKDVALAIGKKLRWALQSRLGIPVALTRTEDQFLTLEERALAANQAQSDVFISLHIGNSNLGYEPVSYAYALKPFWAIPGPGEEKEESGIRKLFVPWEESQRNSLLQSEQLAALVQQEMNRSLNGGDSSFRPRQAPLRLLTQLSMPAVLVEIGDASSAEFKEKAGKNQFQNLVAATVSIAVEKFHSLQERP